MIDGKIEQLKHVSEQMVFMIGTSFILGSLCTVFFLIILDMLKARRHQRERPPMTYDEALEEEGDADR